MLVHGAWHGGWCWEGVATGLHARGIPTYVPELPSAGDDPAALADLHEDAGVVRDVIDRLPGPLVLVGHSYGGAVITEASAGRATVDRLVYVAALLPDEAESVTGLVTAVPSAPFAAAVTVRPDGALGFDAAAAPDVLYNDCAPDVAHRAAARLRLQSALSTRQRPSGVGWRYHPSTYVLCGRDRAVHPELQERMARRCDTTVRWRCGHAPFISRPDRLAGLLAALVEGR